MLLRIIGLNNLKRNKMIELHNGELSYNVTTVIYRGKEFKAPVSVYIIQAYEYMSELLKTGEVSASKFL